MDVLGRQWRLSQLRPSAGLAVCVYRLAERLFFAVFPLFDTDSVCLRRLCRVEDSLHLF